ncbi:GtrA family protein [Hydrogenovibrio sp. 3SP14C1]|uniref:GtrA family protein n=1 Tax=Hydrogenovibrio sp. 3SP14C1 TaxID=3038774 RepID=UPI00241738B9|nr:GtrA family protein [Hydrogenovibrio sp. 3SP14C1]MDG4812245.1 GtrA family protein [Hydrogenovibrio sp. 3SP14C1]
MYIKYLLVGGLNTLFGYLVVIALLFLGVHYAVSVLVATILGVVFNYRSYGRFVFNNRSWSGRYFIRFVGFYMVLYSLNVVIIAVMKYYGVNLYIASFIAVLLIAGLGFVFNQRYVYATKIN